MKHEMNMWRLCRHSCVAVFAVCAVSLVHAEARSAKAGAASAARAQGLADGREFARDNQRIGMAVTHNVCLAGSKVAADNLPPNVPTSARNEYGTAVYNGCMASAR